jgi:hypothetical protein
MTAVPYLDGPLVGQWVEDDAPYRHASTGERANARKCRKLINRWRRSTRTDPFLEIVVNEFYENTLGGYRLAGYDELAWLR